MLSGDLSKAGVSNEMAMARDASGGGWCLDDEGDAASTVLDGVMGGYQREGVAKQRQRHARPECDCPGLGPSSKITVISCVVH